MGVRIHLTQVWSPEVAWFLTYSFSLSQFKVYFLYIVKWSWGLNEATHVKNGGKGSVCPYLLITLYLVYGMCACACVHACMRVSLQRPAWDIRCFFLSFHFSLTSLRWGLPLDLNHLQLLCLHLFSRSHCGSSTAHEAMVGPQASGSRLLCSHCPELSTLGFQMFGPCCFLTQVWASEVRFSCLLSKQWSPLSHLLLHGWSSEFGISPGEEDMQDLESSIWTIWTEPGGVCTMILCGGQASQARVRLTAP